MLTNYLRVAFRQLWRNKTFSAFNIFGLATSMSVCLLVLLILFDQYGYDKFHVDSERIHRIISGDDQYEQVVPRMATAPLDLAEELRQYDAVAHSTQIIPLDRSISHEREPLALRKNGLIIEPSFFSIFTFGWTEQQGMDALGQPATVVITEATAERWFPSQEALGKQVNIYGVGDCTITGIMPTPPRRSHLQFDYLLGKATINALSTAEREAIGLAERNFRNTYRGYVYFKTVDEGSIVQLQSPLTQLAESYTAQTENRYFAFATQPLLDILPSQDLGNEIGIGTPLVIIYFVLSIGLIILLTACFNYTNLTLAKSLQRAREIGVRKVNGARRGQIVRQFLTESVVVAFLSLLVAVVLLEFLIPAFYGLHPFVEDIFYLDKPWFTYPLFFSFSLMVGLLAGALPSWSIARLQPLTALGKLQNARIFSKVGLRKALITFQFTLALICILLVILVVQQKNHVLQADLGIDINEHRSLNLFELDYEVLSQRIGQLPGVTSVAGINSVIFGGYRDTQLGYNQGGDSLRVGYLQVSANYPEHLGMEFLAGGTFPTTSSGQ
ncbi:MAG: FtsX-like permease family protein, partial [Bacteroidota bacterium]